MHLGYNLGAKVSSQQVLGSIGHKQIFQNSKRKNDLTAEVMKKWDKLIPPFIGNPYKTPTELG